MKFVDDDDEEEDAVQPQGHSGEDDKNLVPDIQLTCASRQYPGRSTSVRLRRDDQSDVRHEQITKANIKCRS